MRGNKYLLNGMIATSAAVFGLARLMPGSGQNGPVLTAATAVVMGSASDSSPARPADAVALQVQTALHSLGSKVATLSHPQALDDAFKSYFAFKAAHPGEVRKPFLYFVDYGLPSTTPRGYVFDMESDTIVDGPFAVAHGRGSSADRYGVPTKFSNATGSAATSLGLFVTQEVYDFHGKSGGQPYSSVGLRLMGVSTGFNDNARNRRVVAHGAPYVSDTKAGRSEGCPAMAPSRAERLLPTIANGGLVFLFAPDSSWMAKDPWLASSAG